MGLGPSKGKIKRILQNSCNGDGELTNYDIIQSHYNADNLNGNFQMSQSLESTQIDLSSSGMSISESFALSITNKQTLVQDTGYFPYCSIGTLIAVFPKKDEPILSTCFLINDNVLLTLASNLYKPKYGGDAKEISTSFFIKEKIPLKQIKIMDGYKKNPKPENNFAVIMYGQKVCEEHFGVQPYFHQPEINYSLIASCGCVESKEAKKDEHHNVIIKEDSSFVPSELHQAGFSLELSLDPEQGDEKLPRTQGGAIFYEHMSSEKFVIALLSESYSAQYVTKESLKFMVTSINEGRMLLKKQNQDIDENKIYHLDLSRNDFGPLDIKYLSEFDLRNLRYLDLNSNSIKPQGAFFLSLGKYPNLTTLNLNFNEIGDEGISHIANASFASLEQLFLFHNNISSVGVKSLCKADFIPNLVILSLSENPQISDEGCKYMRENKNWKSLTILNLNRTGLTDEAINILMNTAMPSLRKIHLIGNNFSRNVDRTIQSWTLGNVQVEYDNKKNKIKKLKGIPNNQNN